MMLKFSYKLISSWYQSISSGHPCSSMQYSKWGRVFPWSSIVISLKKGNGNDSKWGNIYGNTRNTRNVGEAGLLCLAGLGADNCMGFQLWSLREANLLSLAPLESRGWGLFSHQAATLGREWQRHKPLPASVKSQAAKKRKDTKETTASWPTWPFGTFTFNTDWPFLSSMALSHSDPFPETGAHRVLWRYSRWVVQYGARKDQKSYSTSQWKNHTSDHLFKVHTVCVYQ